MSATPEGGRQRSPRAAAAAWPPAGCAGAIECTLRALRLRTRRYRDVVITVAVTLLIAAAAAYCGSWRWLVAGAILPVPIAGVFFLADQRALERWRRELLAVWTSGQLDLSGLSAALRGNPHLPRGTLDGMLATLPCAAEVAAERRIPVATRRAAACAIGAMHRQRTDALCLKLLASVVAGGAVLAAVWLERWTPLLALTPLLLTPTAGVRLRQRRTAKAEAEMAACRQHPGFSDADLACLLAGLR